MQPCPRLHCLACGSTCTGSVNWNTEPLPISELDPELAAVHLDDAPRDRQAEAGAALLLGGGIVGLLELLEDLALVGRGDAGAVVLHRDRERAVGRASP